MFTPSVPFLGCENPFFFKIGPDICDFGKNVPAHLFVVRMLSTRIVHVHMHLSIMQYVDIGVIAYRHIYRIMCACSA
jgi:hypothetical protein